ncbi:MAG: phosphonopyruvate decarboxylase [Clostridia bacterium]|nr:phosphonopyruvate decarboxylase [Clostridia bacterium]
MDAAILLKACEQAGIDFYTGVPDSFLKGLCDELYARYGTQGSRHTVAHNEGGAIGLCAGHYLATGRPALCYMQNSGLGNAVNPLASLMDRQVYGMPCLLVIGWRGEPGTKDEPQHVTQGQITLGQLELMEIPYEILNPEDGEEAFQTKFARLREALAAGRIAALVIRKGALKSVQRPAYGNDYAMTREAAVAILLSAGGEGDIYVCTTGKLSREVFEIREARGEGHERDFLTVGSMGHASMIALQIAREKPERRVWCLDGDGAAMMHLGALPLIGEKAPGNLIHVVINNGAHETVGGMPVCSGGLNLTGLAKAAGYPRVFTAEGPESLREILTAVKEAQGPILLEIRCANGARADLGRPTTTPIQNRDALMAYLAERR